MGRHALITTYKPGPPRETITELLSTSIELINDVKTTGDNLVVLGQVVQDLEKAREWLNPDKVWRGEQRI